VRTLDLWRISRFRLTLLHGALFSAALVALLGLIYWQTAGYLTRQVDQILHVEAHALSSVSAESLPARLGQELARDARHIDLYGLFSSDGVWIAGNVRRMPRNLVPDARPVELSAQDGFRPDARALALRLPWGEQLVVGRDVTQLAEVRRILGRTLLWSGAGVVVLGVGGAIALSVRPLRRVRQIQEVSAAIVRGDLAARLPVTRRRDELDMLAGIINTMMDEIEHLVANAQHVGDSIAHDLRTPLTRLRLVLARLHQRAGAASDHRAGLAEALADADALLGRFAALMRIAEIDSHRRRAAFGPVDLGTIVEQSLSLYEPLAEERGVSLTGVAESSPCIRADGELLFEGLGNLIDNAIKFTPKGGCVVVRLAPGQSGPILEVIDNGPGIPAEQRDLALRRFYRAAPDVTPGAGLGLSIVAAVVRLHGFALRLEDAGPGLRARLCCWTDARPTDARAPLG
jgi:signal transduction histidine kinase